MPHAAQRRRAPARPIRTQAALLDKKKARLTSLLLVLDESKTEESSYCKHAAGCRYFCPRHACGSQLCLSDFSATFFLVGHLPAADAPPCQHLAQVNKVVLAYSGGLDTSVILKWLQETYDCEVVTFTADLGQVRSAPACQCGCMLSSPQRSPAAARCMQPAMHGTPILAGC